MSLATQQMVTNGQLLPKYLKGTMSPSARTKQMFESIGCPVVKLEKVIPKTYIKQDVWGADMLVRQGSSLLAIQITDDTNHSHRVEKALASDGVRNWLKGGVLFFIYSWGQRCAKGPIHGKTIRGTKKRWTLRQTQLIMEDGRVKVL